MKALKRKITSVKNTQHIMKAMYMMAASRLQKAKLQLDAVRPLYLETKRVMDEVKGSCKAAGSNVFVNQREVKNTACVLITSDRGLCGGYNANISKKAVEFLQTVENEKIIAVGSKGNDHLKRNGRNVVEKYIGVTENSMRQTSEEIAAFITSQYLSGEIDEAYVVYTEFKSALSHLPRTLKILPLGSEEDNPCKQDGDAYWLDDTSWQEDKMKYDPNVEEFLENVVPMYLSLIIYGTMMEANTCEQAARMTSMNSATNNAKKIIEELTLLFNRKRQDIITQELNEIVSSANALK